MTNPAELIRRVKRIAVVGCSAAPGKDAHDIPFLLLQHGYDIIPVNPKAPEIFGVKAYKSLAEIPGPIDMVNVFRPSEETPEIARQAAAVGAKALWLQLGIAHPEAKSIALAAGMEYVENRCVKIELMRH